MLQIIISVPTPLLTITILQSLAYVTPGSSSTTEGVYHQPALTENFFWTLTYRC